MSLSDARAADRAGELESAAARYEEALAAGDNALQLLLDLALLYWQSTDPGLAAAKDLDPDFLKRAGRRTPELLEEAARAFPGSTAVRFWKRYMAWADLGEPLDAEECRQLLREDPTVLVPVMHVFAASQGRDMQTEAHKLLQQCRDDGTTGARYVASVIEGVMKRAGRQQQSARGARRPQ
jgi:tetratricopeptide (TPR) repeat protein